MYISKYKKKSKCICCVQYVVNSEHVPAVKHWVYEAAQHKKYAAGLVVSDMLPQYQICLVVQVQILQNLWYPCCFLSFLSLALLHYLKVIMLFSGATTHWRLSERHCQGCITLPCLCQVSTESPRLPSIWCQDQVMSAPVSPIQADQPTLRGWACLANCPLSV